MAEPRFRFAVVADTHTRPEAGDLSSPWEVNKLANGRCRFVAALVKRMAPAFTIHLGDVVHPVPVLPSYHGAAQAALEIFADLGHEIRYIPGNHDVGDKPFKANPAGRVTAEAVELYRRYFGAPYASFDHEGCHFVLINSPVLNSGLACETEQKPWLERDLEAHRGKRIFLFTHYPPYVLEPDEPSNYDNLDEPGRGWLLDLVKRYSIEALFAGHVHNFFYHRHGATDCYVLPATSFFRQDYAELFRVEAAPEHGRNDAEKLGFLTVDVYDAGHVARIHRTNGETLAPGAALAPATEQVPSCHPRERRPAPLGVHLRHPWAEVTEFPYNGPMDEFLRKRARNDYTLMTLWELGVRRLRLPIADLMGAETRSRMAALRTMGHEFNVFGFGVPDRSALAILETHRNLVDVLEIVIPWDDAADVAREIAVLKERVRRPLTLAKMETSAEKRTEGSRFSHFVSYGFRTAELGLIDAFREKVDRVRAVDGYVFRLRFEESPWEMVPRLAAFGRERDLRITVNVRLASENPAEYNADDHAIANQVAEAMVVAFAHPRVDSYIDTYVDLDRGYFPRHGLFDRRYNPRPASFVYRHLQGFLASIGEPLALERMETMAGARIGWATAGRSHLGLLLPEKAGTPIRFPDLNIDPTAGKLINLYTGAVGPADVTVPSDTPSLLVLRRP